MTPFVWGPKITSLEPSPFRRAALETIRRGGVPALERLQNDEENVFFDLMIIIR